MANLIYGNQLDRSLLSNVHTPDPVGTHYPIDHNMFLELIEKALDDAGFIVHANEVVVSRNFPSAAEIEFVANNMETATFAEGIGQRAFGGLSITSEDLAGTERQLVCGWRNSHDKSFKSAICIGSRMMVCDNLCFSSERVIGRKHTKNIERDLPAVISKIVYGLVAEWSNMETRIKAYKLVRLTRETAADLVFKLKEHKAIAPTKCATVFDLWLEPALAAKGMIDKTAFIDENDSYDEDAYKAAIASKEHELESAFGKGVSLWGLYNAFTESLKGGDFSKHATRTMAAQALFDSIAGVDIKAQSDVEVEGEDENGVHYDVETTTEDVTERLAETEEEEEHSFSW
jgi:hypothetical protein